MYFSGELKTDFVLEMHCFIMFFLPHIWVQSKGWNIKTSEFKPTPPRCFQCLLLSLFVCKLVNCLVLEEKTELLHLMAGWESDARLRQDFKDHGVSLSYFCSCWTLKNRTGVFPSLFTGTRNSEVAVLLHLPASPCLKQVLNNKWLWFM